MDARPSGARPLAPARTGLAPGGSPCRVRGYTTRAALRVAIVERSRPTGGSDLPRSAPTRQGPAFLRLMPAPPHGGAGPARPAGRGHDNAGDRARGLQPSILD